MEMLIYVSKITNRLFYIIELILKEELGINFKFTTDSNRSETKVVLEGLKLHVSALADDYSDFIICNEKII